MNMNRKTLLLTTVIGTALLALSGAGLAEDKSPVGMVPTDADTAGAVRTPIYSPYAVRIFQTSVYWGYTHVNTVYSLEDKGFGARLNVTYA